MTQENKNEKYKFSFIDAVGFKATLDLEITFRNGYKEFTLCGDYNNSFGQCIDGIKPRTKDQKTLIDLWTEYHLKSVENIKAFDNIKNLVESIIKENEEFLNSELDEDQHILYFEKLKEEKIKALIEVLDLKPSEVINIEASNDNCLFEVDGIDYYVLDDDEVNEKMNDYIKETASYFRPEFLANITELDEEVFKALVDKNEAVYNLIEKTCGMDNFIQECLIADGVGHFLNGYDGTSDEVEIDGILYYVMRC